MNFAQSYRDFPFGHVLSGSTPLETRHVFGDPAAPDFPPPGEVFYASGGVALWHRLSFEATPTFSSGPLPPKPISATFRARIKKPSGGITWSLTARISGHYTASRTFEWENYVYRDLEEVSLDVVATGVQIREAAGSLGDASLRESATGSLVGYHPQFVVEFRSWAYGTAIEDGSTFEWEWSDIVADGSNFGAAGSLVTAFTPNPFEVPSVPGVFTGSDGDPLEAHHTPAVAYDWRYQDKTGQWHHDSGERFRLPRDVNRPRPITLYLTGTDAYGGQTTRQTTYTWPQERLAMHLDRFKVFRRVVFDEAAGKLLSWVETGPSARQGPGDDEPAAILPAALGRSGALFYVLAQERGESDSANWCLYRSDDGGFSYDPDPIATVWPDFLHIPDLYLDPDGNFGGSLAWRESGENNGLGTLYFQFSNDGLVWDVDHATKIRENVPDVPARLLRHGGFWIVADGEGNRLKCALAKPTGVADWQEVGIGL